MMIMTCRWRLTCYLSYLSVGRSFCLALPDGRQMLSTGAGVVGADVLEDFIHFFGLRNNIITPAYLLGRGQRHLT